MYELEKDRLHVARMENNLAVLLIKQNRLVEAAGHVETSLRQLEELGQEAGKANAVLTKAELEYRRGNLVAAEHTAAGRYNEALPLLGEVTDEDPQDFWAWFLRGVCHDRLSQGTEALACYSTCIALAPREPAGVALEEPLDEQVIFQQSAAAAPLQSGEAPLIDAFLERFHTL